MTNWDKLAIAYVIITVLAFVPAIITLLRGVERYRGDIKFSSPVHFSEETRKKWDSYCADLPKITQSWRRNEEFFAYSHRYCVISSISTSGIVTILSALDTRGEMHWLIVALSGVSGVALALHKRFRIDPRLRLLKKYRGELSDLIREYQHNPRKDASAKNAGDAQSVLELAQIENFIAAANDIRKKAYAEEVANLPDIDHGNGRSTARARK